MRLDDQRRARWLSEFEDLGAEKVRNGMMVGGWEKEKRSAARQWLEHRDARNFQAARPSGSPPHTFFMKRRATWWWAYAAAAVLIMMGIARILRRW